MLEDLFPQHDFTKVPAIAGVPRFLYREWLHQCRKYFRALFYDDALGRLIEELWLLRLFGLFYDRWRRPLGRPPAPALGSPPLTGIGLSHPTTGSVAQP